MHNDRCYIHNTGVPRRRRCSMAVVAAWGPRYSAASVTATMVAFIVLLCIVCPPIARMRATLWSVQAQGPWDPRPAPPPPARTCPLQTQLHTTALQAASSSHAPPDI